MKAVDAQALQTQLDHYTEVRNAAVAACKAAAVDWAGITVGTELVFKGREWQVVRFSGYDPTLHIVRPTIVLSELRGKGRGRWRLRDRASIALEVDADGAWRQGMRMLKTRRTD